VTLTNTLRVQPALHYKGSFKKRTISELEDLRRQVGEVSVPQSLVGSDPLLSSLLQQLVGQVVGERDVVEDRPNVAQPLRPVERHLVRTVVGETAHSGPHLEKDELASRSRIGCYVVETRASLEM